MRKILFFSALGLLVVHFAAAAFPLAKSAAGKVRHGETLVIHGTGFGLKTPANPILWETFEEDAAPGDFLTASYKNHGDSRGKGWGAPGTGRSGPMFVATQAYSGYKSLFNRVTNGIPNSEFPGESTQFNTNNYFFTPVATDKVYYSYRWRYSVGNVNADNYGIGKMGRVNASPNKYNGPGNMMFSNFNPFYDSGPSFLMEVDATQTYSFKEWPAKPSLNQWQRHEIYGHASTAGVADGDLWIAFSGNGDSWERSYTDVMTRGPGQTFVWDNVILGLMMANPRPTGDVRFWVDDVYIDDTPARVELGNNLMFNECTEREIQIPVAWSDGSIQIKVNQGKFKDGQTAYLFVVNRDGAMSPAGLPVVIGQELQSSVLRLTEPAYGSAPTDGYPNAKTVDVLGRTISIRRVGARATPSSTVFFTLSQRNTPSRKCLIHQVEAAQ